MVNLIRSQEVKPVNFYVNVGSYERVVGKTLLPDPELDFVECNRRLDRALAQKRYKYVYREFHTGHSWGNWRVHLKDGLIYFFGK